MKIISIKAIKADNFWEKCVGLIGKSKNTCLYLETRFGIHTFGMRYKIDILILDKKNIVHRLKRSLPPNRFFFWNPFFKKVLELPDSAISKKNIKLTDKINILFFR